MGNLYAATPGQSPGVARIYIYIYVWIWIWDRVRIHVPQEHETIWNHGSCFSSNLPHHCYPPFLETSRRKAWQLCLSNNLSTSTSLTLRVDQYSNMFIICANSVETYRNTVSVLEPWQLGMHDVPVPQKSFVCWLIKDLAARGPFGC